MTSDLQPMTSMGYPVKTFPCATRRYCQTLSLKNSPELIAAYRKIHSREDHWAVIRDGIRSVGILEMEIYILGTRLFMIIEAPADLDLDDAMARLATLPRQKEWEAFVDKYQECAPGGASSEKWQLMERMFYLYD